MILWCCASTHLALHALSLPVGPPPWLFMLGPDDPIPILPLDHVYEVISI